MKKLSRGTLYKLMFWLFLLVGIGLTVWFVFIRNNRFDRCAQGLVLNIIGVLIMVYFGFPQYDYSETVGRGVELGTPVGPNGETDYEYGRKQRALAKWHKLCSIVGVGYMFVGFVFQLIHQLSPSL